MLERTTGTFPDNTDQTRAEDSQGTPTQSHISPSILVYEDYSEGGTIEAGGTADEGGEQVRAPSFYFASAFFGSGGMPY